MKFPVSSVARKRRATVLVLVTLSLIGVLGIVALVLDRGLLQDNRRRAQAAADAAALAGAVELFKSAPAINADSTGTVIDPGDRAHNAALQSLSDNGFDSSNSTVTVNLKGHITNA